MTVRGPWKLVRSGARWRLFEGDLELTGQFGPMRFDAVVGIVPLLGAPASTGVAMLRQIKEERAILARDCARLWLAAWRASGRGEVYPFDADHDPVRLHLVAEKFEPEAAKQAFGQYITTNPDAAIVTFVEELFG